MLLLSLNNWIKEDEEIVIELAALQHEVTERVTSEVFRLHEVEILTELIYKYLDLRKRVFAEHPILGKVSA